MNCTNHPSLAEGLALCTRCEQPFCPSCLAALGEQHLCAPCKLEAARDLLSGLRPGELYLASIMRRFGGLWLDSLLLQCVGYGVVGAFTVGIAAAFAGNQQAQTLASLFLWPFFLGVNVVYEGALVQFRGQTLGKMAARVKVVSADGTEVSAGQAWARAALKAVLGSCVGLTYWPAYFTRERTTLHDRIARTRVVMVDALYSGPHCPQCSRPLDAGRLLSGQVVCPSCTRQMEVARFDPVPSRPAVLGLSEAGPEGGTPCPAHEQNAATAGECARCGVFLCGLCATPAEAATYCPPCFLRLCGDGALRGTGKPERDWAATAFTSALLCLALAPVAVVWGPMAVYAAARARAQKRAWGDSEGYARVWASGVIGVLGTVGGVALLAVFLRSLARS